MISPHSVAAIIRVPFVITSIPDIPPYDIPALLCKSKSSFFVYILNLNTNILPHYDPIAAKIFYL